MNKSDFKHIEDEYKRQSKYIARCTHESLIYETPEQQEKRIKRLLKPENYNDFFNYYFGKDTPIPMADSDCARFHTRATVELFKNDIITQFRRWFRGSAKSTHTTIGNPLLLKQTGKMKFNLTVGANEKMAKQLLSDIQAQLAHNSRIINDFGKQETYGSWADGMFETRDGCFFMALGIEQPFRGLRKYGNRIDLAIVDDCEDRKVANNERLVRERSEKILSDLGGAFSKDIQRMVICNNHITNSGILNYMLKQIGDSPYTKDSVVNIVDKHGNPTWKERYSKKDVEIQRTKHDYYTWMREFMNTPIEAGAIFKDEHILYTQVPSINQYDALVVYGDLSYKDTGDYKAMGLIGKKGRNFYLINCFVRRTSRAECAKWLYDLYEDYNLQKYNVRYWIEGLFAQDEFVNDFDTEGDARGYYVPVVADNDSKGNKYDRIESMLGFFERGNVFFNQKYKDNKDFKAMNDQLLAFEKGSKANDDAPDMLQSGISKLNTVTYVNNSKMTIGTKQRNQKRY